MTALLVLYELKSPAVVLTLNRPEKRNALNRQLIRDLHQAFEKARNDAAARCVILTGAGPAFCAGMDLAELSATLDQPHEAELVQQDAERLSELYEFIYTLPKPTIAAVNGPAVAGGAGLVTVCDLAIASSEAKIGYPEVRRGLVAAMVMPHLLRHVGERTARELLLGGDLLDSYEGWRVGLFNDTVDAADLMPTCMDMARKLAESGPQALAMTKELLRRFVQERPDRRTAARGSADARLTVECKEGLRAFLEKRPAPWVKG
jgi:methylglutaconyl-CoA hydratase